MAAFTRSRRVTLHGPPASKWNWHPPKPVQRNAPGCALSPSTHEADADGRDASDEPHDAEHSVEAGLPAVPVRHGDPNLLTEPAHLDGSQCARVPIPLD